MVRKYLYIVANNIKPYAFEAVKVLALPVGSKFQARFTREWVQDDILSYPNQFTGKTGYFILRDWNEDNLIPIRIIEIEKITPLGNIVIISYIVKDYLEYKDSKEGRIKQLNIFNSRFSESITEINPKREKDSSMSPLVFTSNSFVPIENSDTYAISPYEKVAKKWLNTIFNFSSMDLFKGMSFVLPLVIDNKNKPPQKNSWVVSGTGNAPSV